MTQDYSARGARAAVHRPGHALPVGGPPRRQHVRGAGSPTSSRRAGTACSSWPRRPRARSCATRARRCARGDARPGARRGARAGRRRGAAAAARPRAARRCRSTSRARSSELFERAALDLCHVHEPFAPSVASTALRHSRALNVGTFHAPDRARAWPRRSRARSSQLVFGRLDARTAAYGATRDAAAALLPRRLRDRHARRRRRAAPRRRATTGACASRSSSRRSAARCGCSCARCAASTRRCLGRGRALRARAVVLDAAARRPARARALRRGRAARRWPAPTCSSPPPTASRPRRG